jgi:pSer/pThr/pTyr-binding forkhead associated (FHA) protein
MYGELDPIGGGDPIPLLKPELVIGRRRSKCDITLEAGNISSQHCRIRLDQGYLLVEDLSSRNGIKVNEIRCQKRYLMPGDVLSIAKTQFQVNYEPQSDGPPPEVEEDILSMSLMEKAGLVSRRRDEKGRPMDSHAKPPTAKPPRTINGEEDQVIQWLSEMPSTDDD